MSAVVMTPHCEPYVRAKALDHLRRRRLVILAGGTGSPFFTTDMCAALRACELGAEVLLKATKVDGVYDADPETNPTAKKYDRLTYDRVLADRLGVMDLTAISMCMENRLPVRVFRLTPDNLEQALAGEAVGTLVAEDETTD